MRFSRLDAFYRMASKGDSDAYNKMYSEFSLMCKRAILGTLRNYRKNTGISEDFYEYIDSLFVKIINEYNNSKGSFSTFCEYSVNQKITARISEEILSNKHGHFSLDDIVVEDKSYLDVVADEGILDLRTEVAVENFKYMISSPNRRLTKAQRLRNTLLKYRYLGYKDIEICDLMKITLSQLRNISKKIKEDEEINNFKLELK